MTTRRETFEQSNTERMADRIEGVTFLNIPAIRNEDGTAYDSGVYDILDEIAHSIPEQLRGAFIVDCDKLPIWDMREERLEQLLGYKPPEEREVSDAELELMRLIGNEQAP